LATILSYNSRQALWDLQALKLHINSKFLSFGFPCLLIPDLPLTLLPERFMSKYRNPGGIN
jgi:hypothetical protein